MTSSLVAISIPALDFCPPAFAISLARMTTVLTYERKLNAKKPVDLLIQHTHNTQIAGARNSLVRSALEKRASHVLFLDSDMTFPQDTLRRLMAHNLPIVGATYARRRPPFETIGTPDGPLFPGSSLRKMSIIPLGCCLITAEVFHTIPAPWFSYHEAEAEEDTVSEDTNFCRFAEMYGFNVFCDLTLTREVAHIGTSAHAVSPYSPIFK